MSAGSAATIVVPCFNEGERLDEAAFVELATGSEVRLLFVNDGSTDSTAARLEAMTRARPDRIEALTLEVNQGKAEAVRSGMRRALGDGARAVGYLDADLATPTSEILRLARLLDTIDADVVIASRVLLLGKDIRRRPWRHYLGRMFASGASVALGLPVYDTQCGAKVFRRTPQLEAALSEPFMSRWIFDVELLGRLVTGAPGVPPLPVERLFEEPLRTWHDVPGSKITFKHMARAATELASIGASLRAQRRRR